MPQAGDSVSINPSKLWLPRKAKIKLLGLLGVKNHIHGPGLEGPHETSVEGLWSYAEVKPRTQIVPLKTHMSIHYTGLSSFWMYVHIKWGNRNKQIFSHR